METPTTNKFQMMAIAATATVFLITSGLNANTLTPSKLHSLKTDDDKKSWDEYTRTPYYIITGESNYYAEDYFHDIYVSLAPKRHYLIKAKISHVIKGEPKAIITDDANIDV